MDVARIDGRTGAGVSIIR